MHSIAIFGGTFDPIHNGHLQTSLTLQSHFNFNQYLFLPCKVPTIKPMSSASSEQRIDMLRLAIATYKHFSLDLREINRDTPSYMVETLKSFRAEHKDASITLIIGYDAFIYLPQWYQWEELIQLANLIVINRDEFAHLEIAKELHALLKQHQTMKDSELLTSRSGLITLFNAGDYSISSSGIRNHLKEQKNVEDKLPKAVYEYIKQWQLYQ